MRTLVVFLFFGLVVVCPTWAVPTVVSASQLAPMLKAGGYQILDSRPRAAYRSGHLEGALSVDTKTIYEDSPQTELHFPPFPVIAEKLGVLGVRSNVPTVVYGDQLQMNREAGMLFFYLYLLGSDEIYFLDGGIQKWRQEGLPVTAQESSPQSVVFGPRVRTTSLVSKEALRESLGTPDLVLVDTRSPQEYSGDLPGNHIGSPGHIPTALSIEFSQALNADGTFKSLDALKSLYASVASAKRVVLYCRTGPRTSATGLALISLLGLGNVQFYTGSMIEWSNTAGFPVVRGSTPLP